MEDPNNPNVFGFLAVFPSGTRFTISTVFPEVGVVDVAMATEFAKRMVATLRKKRDEASVRYTNWVSAAAAIQRLLIDFNNKRGAREPSGLVAPDGRPLQ